MAADRALPLSPAVTASKSLLRCVGVLVMIPIRYLSWCFGSKRAMLTHCSPCTIWAFVASCALEHTGHPEMRAPRWTVGA